MRTVSLLVALMLLTPLVGCRRESRTAVPAAWLQEGIAHRSATIDLGYRGDRTLADGHWEPIARIVENGHPVAGAMVFTTVLSAADGRVIDGESATRYERAPADDRALYTPGKIQLPADSRPCIVRFRVVLPGTTESWTREVSVRFD